MLDANAWDASAERDFCDFVWKKEADPLCEGLLFWDHRFISGSA